MVEGGDYHREQMGKSTALPDSAQAPFIVGSCFFPSVFLIFFFETLYVLKNLAARKVGSWHPFGLDFKRGRRLSKAIPVYPRRMGQIVFYRVVSLNACTDLSAH